MTVLPLPDDHAVIEVERAIHDLRMGRPVRVLDESGELWLRAAEFSGDRLPETGTLLVSAERLHHIGVTLTAKAGQVMLDGLSSTQRDELLKGQPMAAAPDVFPAGDIAAAGLQLLKLAQLLPIGLLAIEYQAEGWLTVQAEHIAHYPQAVAARVSEVAQARLPLNSGVEATVRVFRAPDDAVEHLLIVFGDPSSEAAPLVRVHSSCLTGDVLGSLRCDCGDQLQEALHALAAHGSGVLVYLNQEGRGIGIANKMRAYALQDEGADTFDANERLGFAADERQFALAAAMLKALAISKVTLLTNNPRKVAELERYAVRVVERRPLEIAPNVHNRNYLNTKAARFGHLLAKRD